MTSKHLVRLMALVVVVVVVGVGPNQGVALARRAPGPGGSVVVAMPQDLIPAVVEAHVFAPLLVPRTGDEPVVRGAPEHASSVLVSLMAEDADRRWRLKTRAPAADVAFAIARCLEGRGERRHPAAALRAAGVVVTATVASPDEVLVRFNQPVGALPELLAWCPLRPALGAPTGPYTAQGPGRLAWRSGSFEAPPLLAGIELRGPLTGQERADVVVAPGGADLAAGGATLLSPWPDVIVMVQQPETATADPFGLREPDTGVAAFRQALRADLLAAAWAAGRGGPTEALLPPGVAPARPLPPSTSVASVPLALTPIPRNAPRLPMWVEVGDSLSDAVAERLAVLLRGKGILLETRRNQSADEGGELVRWHPPSRDAALSLLSFVGEREALVTDGGVQRALEDPRLLGREATGRLAAALALERALLDSRLVVPLIVVERAITVDPDLRGVVLRGDGIPMLDGAWWGGGR
jgi:hypothetical protein